jgi:hypothetical protein
MEEMGAGMIISILTAKAKIFTRMGVITFVSD